MGRHTETATQGAGIIIRLYRAFVRMPIAIAVTYCALAALGDLIPTYVWVLYYVSLASAVGEIILHRVLQSAIALGREYDQEEERQRQEKKDQTNE